MGDDTKKPQMSHARSMNLDYQENKLDRASQNVREQYERAKAAQIEQQKAQTSTQKEQNGSEMIKKDSPPMHPAPDRNMRQASDRQSYNDRLAQERQRAAELSAAAKTRNKQQKQVELDNERDKNNDDRSR